MRKNWNNGFTIAELLVVVAIIVVLVAVSIPIFTGKVEKAKEATCLSNKTALYHEIAADLIAGDITYEQIDDALLAAYVAKQEAKCPSDGTYSISKDTENETFKVVCSYHDQGKTTVLKGMGSETDRASAFGGKNGDFTKELTSVMATLGVNKIGAHYDSSAESQKTQAIDKYLAGKNITSNGTKYWSLRQFGGTWYYYYSTKDISSYKSGDTITLARYNTKTDKISMVTTTVTSYAIDKKNYYNLITYTNNNNDKIVKVNGKEEVSDAEAIAAMNNQ